LFFNIIPHPRYVLSDQAKGFIESLAEQWCLHGTFHQLFEWHIVQNIKKYLGEQKYNKKQQDYIQHLVLKYIHSTTKDGVIEARHNLY